MAKSGTKKRRDVTIKIKVRKIDYEKFAQESGENAYRSAKAAGFDDKVAERFKQVFGAPVEPEFRL